MIKINYEAIIYYAHEGPFFNITLVLLLNAVQVPSMKSAACCYRLFLNHSNNTFPYCCFLAHTSSIMHLEYLDF